MHVILRYDTQVRKTGYDIQVYHNMLLYSGMEYNIIIFSYYIIMTVFKRLGARPAVNVTRCFKCRASIESLMGLGSTHPASKIYLRIDLRAILYHWFPVLMAIIEISHR